LNLLIDHDHMQILLSFISGLGPRKAKKFIQDLKSRGTKIYKRGEIFMAKYLDKHVFSSASAFLKIRIPPEEKVKD
jgi:transcriptional accessory protein Tex/SPT6